MPLKEKFIGAWAPPATADKLKALAHLRGVSQSEVLRGLVEEAATRASGVSTVDSPGHAPAAAMQNRDAVTVGGQRVAVPA